MGYNYSIKPAIKSSIQGDFASESRRWCEFGAKLSVNGLMRADERYSSSNRRKPNPLSFGVAYGNAKRIFINHGWYRRIFLSLDQGADFLFYGGCYEAEWC